MSSFSASTSTTDDSWDAVVVGGAVAGAGCAILLKRLQPEARILIVERSERFPPKVGEATVEVSAFFLSQVLAQQERFEREQLPKYGLRFWFSDRSGRGLGEMSEVGARELSRVPTFQLDRVTCDEGVLATAVEAGCELLRPAKVVAWEEGWPQSRLEIKTREGERRTVLSRWLIDASGRQAFVARRKKLLTQTDSHPLASVWDHWRGVTDIDGPELLAATDLPPNEHARRLATNHFCGYGWWCWMIPLASGLTSIGLVYDKRLFELPGNGPLAERYHAFLRAQPGLAELLADAEPVAGDLGALARLPYATSRYADRGWALVGDAAAFLDPYYSPGLDHAAMSAYATAHLVAGELSERPGPAELDGRLAAHNEVFLRSIGRWLDALYLDKYELLGDAELTRCSYLVDTALYYLGIVSPILRDERALANATFGLARPSSLWAWRTMRFFKRRLVRIARFRRHVGIYGRHNIGRRWKGPAPGLGLRAIPMLATGLAAWLRLELGHLAARIAHGGRDLSRPVALDGTGARANGRLHP